METTRPVRPRRRLLIPLLVVLVLAEAAWIAYPYVRTRVLSLEETPAVRGHRLAAELGCFACHGPAGGGGTANPGSDEDEVPAFTEQTQMMYVKSTDDLREYILDGAPKRRRDDPDYVARMLKAGLHMPAYRPFVTAAEVDDLVAYLRSTSGQIIPEEDLARKGADLAIELDCFSCHGPLGAGGVPNPGSFKGYIPGFWGRYFDELVENDEELHQWIADGKIPRIAEHPVGKVFFNRQAAKMPAYGSFVKDGDVAALAAYVRWIRAGDWLPLTK
jgi:mono/diheme cytochrome c family protein